VDAARIWRYLGRPQAGMRTLYRRVRRVAIWRRPRLTARGDPDHDHVVAGVVARLIELPRRAVVPAEDETHLNLLPHGRASWTLRGIRPQIPTPGKNRQVTVLGAIEVTTGAWMSRLGRAEELRDQHRRHLARPTETDPRLLPQPLTRPDARRRRALDQPLAAATLRAELLECRLARPACQAEDLCRYVIDRPGVGGHPVHPVRRITVLAQPRNVRPRILNTGTWKRKWLVSSTSGSAMAQRRMSSVVVMPAR
jgi:hypothetical protein